MLSHNKQKVLYLYNPLTYLFICGRIPSKHIKNFLYEKREK